MKTALFEDKSVDKSIWNEISLWNRSFARRVKTGTIRITEGREPYKFRYILQKDKTSPLAILFPSVGESANTHHSLVFGKMFYDNGYSVVMQGNHFNWEFVKSMPEGFAPGNPDNDSEYIRQTSLKILENLYEKYGYNPREKVILGTSLGGTAALFLAEKESKNNTLNINKYIAISPPIEFNYVVKQLDKNCIKYDNNSTEIKDKTAITAAKILQVLDKKDNKNFNLDTLPFSEEESKLITTFIFRQKLSDLILTLENARNNKESEIYEMINNMSFQDYVEKYLAGVDEEKLKSIYEKTNLYSLSDYLINNDNYKIYEALDDYFINRDQIQKLKNLAGSNLTCINCGAHLGFLYRKEFLDDLKKSLFTQAF